MSWQDGILRAFHRVPYVTGELFRATKAPTIILLIGFVGIPIVLSIYMTTYRYMYNSTLPIELFTAGATQFGVENAPDRINEIPTHNLELLRSMTPGQKQFGKVLVIGWFALSVVRSVAFLWWITRAFQFIKRRVTIK